MADPKRTLTPREHQVAELVVDGLSNKQIAERLVVSLRTVQSHVAAAMSKTQTRTRTQLAVYVLRARIVPLEPGEPASGEGEPGADQGRKGGMGEGLEHQ